VLILATPLVGGKGNDLGYLQALLHCAQYNLHILSTRKNGSPSIRRQKEILEP